MMSVHTARSAANSGLLVGLTRMGFIGYGLLHLAVAWLAWQIAFGQAGEAGDQSGAFRTLAAQPFGRFLLWLIIVGLGAMAIWQASLAIWGHRQKHGRSRVFERLASAARVLVYTALAFTAGRVVTGAPSSSGDQQQNATAGIMAKPAGVWLVGLAGLVVLAVGIGMVIYGGKRVFEQKLNLAELPWRARNLAVRTGQVGYVAKGIAFSIVGYLLVDAAIRHDASKSRGLDAALHTLAGQPYGKFLLVAVALGFAAFGVYCFFQSRYRRVGT